MQSLQNQFVKAVASDGAHIITPLAKIMANINSLRHLQNYLPMQKRNNWLLLSELFWKSKFNKHHAPACYNGAQQ